MSNKLQNEKSPYLLQHKDNPVNWYPWGNEAFQTAIHDDKPIFLSIGYSTCHWCHVMAHESFENTDVAYVLNRSFISIKVDREERPDIDAVYMSVCQAITGSGGWPLTIIMTPEQKPFFAGTYFPDISRNGQVGLIDILEQIAAFWESDRDKLLNAGEQITNILNQERSISVHTGKTNLFESAYKMFRHQFDSIWGGFGPAPKFPSPHHLLFLMRYAQLEDDLFALEMAEKTLNAMADGGIHDQIGGGFSRYSTDKKWLIPHFEKMLYDNALLVLAYLQAYQITKKEHYASIVRETLTYMVRELLDESGGFYCGQDADSDGVEGKYYIFTQQEIKQVLGLANGSEFCRIYGIKENGRDGYVPNRIGQEQPGWDKEDVRLKKLYEYRLTRTSLHLDDKILLSWNAWTILSFTKSAQIFADSRYLDLAVTAQKFIEKHMTNNNRLYIRWRHNEVAYTGQLDDYAVYALALLVLYTVTFEFYYLEKAMFYAGQMIDLFEDKVHGGFYMTAYDAESLIVRPKEIYDGAIPCGNSVAFMVLQKLAVLTGEDKWIKAAARQEHFISTIASAEINSFALLAMYHCSYPQKKLICVSADGIPAALTLFVHNAVHDDLSILVKTRENAERLERYMPALKNYPFTNEKVMYYLCKDGMCLAPESDLQKLFREE